MRPRRLLERLQAGHLDNVRFRDAQRLMVALGFEHLWTRGSHLIYEHQQVSVRISLQPRRGLAKPYQLRQVLRVVSEYNLEVRNP